RNPRVYLIESQVTGGKSTVVHVGFHAADGNVRHEGGVFHRTKPCAVNLNVIASRCWPICSALCCSSVQDRSIAGSRVEEDPGGPPRNRSRRRQFSRSAGGQDRNARRADTLRQRCQEIDLRVAHKKHGSGLVVEKHLHASESIGPRKSGRNAR